ncbi:MAG: adenylate/guanylate cyclase domain-containing protein [Alphaproteobacteria bacterium]|nr:adenylate/guanylate cyclase domain-containing protein [Alphaproteobacteria bacterium]
MSNAIEIHVLTEKKWRVLKAFTGSERSTAEALYRSLTQRHGYEGKKLVEERIKENGLFYAHTLSFRIFDPNPTGGSGQAALAPVKPKKNSTRPRRGAVPPPASRKPGVFETIVGFFREYGRQVRVATENLFRVEKTEPIIAAVALETVKKVNTAINPNSTHYLQRYEDETNTDRSDLIVLESSEVLGSDFFGHICRQLDAHKLDPGGNAAFKIAICCFTVGALMKIDSKISLTNKRGLAVLSDTLKVFISQDDAVMQILDKVKGFLVQPASIKFVKAGAKCFEHYENADFDALESLFETTFDIEPAGGDRLGAARSAGIIFTRIMDIDRLSTDLLEPVVDHHSRVVDDAVERVGGDILKHLGDGLMVRCDSVAVMLRFVVAVLKIHNEAEASPTDYTIAVGAQFGDVVLKDGDCFGITVQVAAQLSARAPENSGAMPADLRPMIEAEGGLIVGAETLSVTGIKNRMDVLHVR